MWGVTELTGAEVYDGMGESKGDEGAAAHMLGENRITVQ